MGDPQGRADSQERPPMERRRSRNPIKNMMQHLTVDAPEDDGPVSPKRESLIRRLSRRSSRSPSAHSEASFGASSPGAVGFDPALCENCASLAADFELMFDEVDFAFCKAVNPGADDAFDKKEYFVSRLKELEENRWTVTCPLCKVFWEIHIPGEGEGEYCLSAFSSRDTNYIIDGIKAYDTDHPIRSKNKGVSPGFLGVVPKMKGPTARPWDVSADWFRETGMLFRTPPEPVVEATRGRTSGEGSKLMPDLPPKVDDAWVRKGIWGREIGRQVDLSVARNWLEYCQSRHPSRCGRRPLSTELPGFRFIDCSQNPPTVVKGSIQEDYVALSYVCGKDNMETWPLVVRDAVSVTRGLGVRYLWVDRICLDDSRPQEKQLHIARMYEIFEGAVVTIIAAAGEDATHGLPGVGSTTRPPQPKYKFSNSNTALVSSLQDPRLGVQASKWYTRSWTYQEGLLARRRLIFTSQQMYWECEGMACPETLVLPLDFYHDMEEQRMCDFLRPGLFNGVSYVDGSWEVWKRLPRRVEQPSTLSIFRESDQHIVNYTRRHLTHDQDSLSAFLGISRRLEATLGNGKLSSIVGIPLWAPPDSAGTKPGPPRTRDLFALSMCFWHHKAGKEPKRRPHLPSWTWAGWGGAVDLFSSIIVSDPEGKAKDRKILNHHYVSVTQLTRNEQTSVRWTYSPEMVLLRPDGSMAYDFGAGRKPDSAPSGPPRLAPERFSLHVSDPLVLDRVKARTHAGGWIFNDLSVDVKMSRGRGSDAVPPTSLGAGAGGPSSIRDFLERHARGEWMTVLWFIEETTVMLLVVERTPTGAWERVGRMRMAFVEDNKAVLRRCGDLDGLLDLLPLRSLGKDLVLQ